MELILATSALAIGICIGAAGYRYVLKRNPAKLEAWARQIKLAREAAERKL